MYFAQALWLVGALVSPPTSDGKASKPTSSSSIVDSEHNNLLKDLVEHPAIAALALDKRPRRKLHSRHTKFFREYPDYEEDSTTKLFNRLGQMACNAGGVVPRKELFETYAAAVLIHHHFWTKSHANNNNTNSQIHRIADMAAGHGLLSWFLLALIHDEDDEHKTNNPDLSNSTPTTALCVDRTMPGSATEIANAMREHFPGIVGATAPPVSSSSSSSDSSSPSWTYVEADLAAAEAHPSALMVSVHACGSLTDFLIEKAIAGRAPLAIVPCCHTVQTKKGYMPHPVFCEKTVDEVAALVEEQRIMLQKPMEHVLDEIRIQTLQNAGYQVEQVLLPSSFTKQNRLILATPLSSFEIENNHGMEETDVNAQSPTQSTTFFERQGHSAISSSTSFYGLRIPLADDEESRTFCQDISGRTESAKRLRQAIPKYYAPRLDVSIWLSGGQETMEEGALKEECELIQQRLQKLALECCDSYNTVHSQKEASDNPIVTCSVQLRGSVAVQQSSGRQSQCYRAEYTAVNDDDVMAGGNKKTSLKAVSKATAKAIDEIFREQIENVLHLSIRGR